MAMRSLKPCKHPGCRELTRSVYCSRHAPTERQRRSAGPAEWHKLYGLPIWTDRLRPDQLLKEPYCRACTARSIRECRPELARVLATDVDHVVPHRGSMQLFADPANLQSLCHSCHARKTAAEQAQMRAEKSR